MAKTTKVKEITLNDLALMMKKGFDEVGEQIQDLKKDVSSLKEDVSSLKEDVSSLKENVSSLKKGQEKHDKAIFELRCDVKELKVGQEKHTRKIGELKDVVRGVFRIEMGDLKKRVTKIENKLGITH